MAQNPILIHVGRGDIYINVPIPTVPPVPLNVDGSPQPGGRYIGSTLDAAALIVSPTTFDIETQQDTGNVGYVTIKEDARIEFTPGELSYENLRDLTLSRLDQVTGISFGGIIFPQLFSVLIVAPRRAGGFISAMLYQAIFGEARNWAFARQNHQAPKVAARAQSLTTRNQGDRLGYYFPNTPFGTPPTYAFVTPEQIPTGQGT
jgi:hypothetical protein